MDIRLMGDVEIHDGAHTIPLLRAGERCVLASLALDPGRHLHVDTLVDRVWGDDPPAGAGDTIASYARTVRKSIQDAGGAKDWLRNHRPATYQLTIDPDLVDYHRFTRLVTRARRSQRDGTPADAVAHYREAVALRTGEALGRVTGQWAANRGYTIEQEYLDAVCALYEQQLTIGEYTAVATHATSLVLDVVPTDRLIALAVHGLARSGQHAAVPGFVARATQRMWDTAQARPSPHVLSLARQLVANPILPAELADAPAAPQPEPESTPDPDPMDPAADSHDSSPDEPDRSGSVTLIATNNQQVFQAGGNQYIARS